MNIFFVDDEPLTLQYLKKILDWNSLNIKITGTAGNGKDALNQIQNELPDILITDIRMPVLDGISLIEEVRKCSINTRIIVLSAYSDFEYARKVFSSGISGYLVKPIDEDKLLELIEKTITELHDTALESEKSSFSQILAIETLLLEQMTKPNTDENFYNKFQKLKKVPDLSNFQLLSVTFSNSSFTREAVIESLQLSLSNLEDSSTYLIRTGVNNWILLLESEIGSIDVSSIGNFLKENLDSTTYLTVSALHSSPEELPSAYKEIQYLNSLHYYATDSCYIFYRKRKTVITHYEIKLNEAVELYFTHIKNHNSNSLNKYISVLDDELIGIYESDISGYQNFWTLFIILVRTRLNKHESHMQIPSKLQEFNSSTLQTFKDSSEVISFIQQITLEITKTPASVPGDSIFSPIKNIKEYVHEHFAEKLTLEDIADNFSMSKNYLCRIFKDTAGCTLWDYLTMIRVEHAKHLLEQSKSGSAEIALLVGYDNQGYFSSVFKRKTGISPKQYRNSINNREPYL